MRVILLLIAGALACSAQYLNPEKSLRKVTDHVYVATGYALGNVIYVITDTRVVVVDTTESPRAAQATLDDFRKVSQLPISHIVYTHSHGDHINGAKRFNADRDKSVAHPN